MALPRNFRSVIRFVRPRAGSERIFEKNVNTRGPIVAVQGNVRVVNTIDNFISTVPCNEQYVVQNSTISNSGDTYSVSLPATVNLLLPNITHYDSDGEPVELPAMVGFTAQTCEDANYILINTATPPDTLDSGSIAAGGSEEIIAPPVTVLVNGQPFAVVPSDETVDVPVPIPFTALTDSMQYPVTYIGWTDDGVTYYITRITLSLNVATTAEAVGDWADRYTLIYT